MPFNTTLNWSATPNVEFDAAEAHRCRAADAEEERVVGRALRDIAAGEELTQECAPTTADLVYRYGFAPAAAKGSATTTLPEDTVSLSFESLVAAATEVCGSAAAGNLARRRALLCQAGCLDQSPWDGLDGLVTAEVQRGGVGVEKLLGACLGLCVNDARWAAAEAAVAAAVPGAARSAASEDESEEDESGSDEGSASSDEEDGSDDLTAAALVAALTGASQKVAEALRKVAVADGGRDGDPWPSLLRLSKRPPWRT